MRQISEHVVGSTVIFDLNGLNNRYRYQLYVALAHLHFYAVKLAYKDHPRDQQNVVLIYNTGDLKYAALIT